MRHTELFYLLALRIAEGIGDVTAKKIISRFGSAQEAFKASARELEIAGLSAHLVQNLRNVSMSRIDQELDFMERNCISALSTDDAGYPERLRHIYDAPLLLFSKGKTDLSSRKVISIVGTRNLTPAGAAFCAELIESLSPLDPVIVSGLAFGADIAAHQAAVSCGLATIGVVAHGLDIVYPMRHTGFADAMLGSGGGLLSEFMSETEPLKQNFVRRNRIVAGLSEATVVIESAEKGGSLITANFAIDYNREVFAVPGRPADVLSRGCNNLIKTQKAHLITSAADLLYVLNWEMRARPIQKTLFIELEAPEQKIYDYLSAKGREMIDVIAIDCELPVFELSPMLLNMELKGAVRPLPGKLFEAI